MSKQHSEKKRGHPIVLFDGMCGLCDATVQRLIARDKHAVLRFASLQSEAGRLLLERYGVAMDLSTMVLIDGGRAYLRSRAMLRTLGHLEMPWRALSGFRVIPACLFDPFYRLVAQNRFRIRGRLERCRVPGPGELERFVESGEQLEALENGV